MARVDDVAQELGVDRNELHGFFERLRADRCVRYAGIAKGPHGPRLLLAVEEGQRLGATWLQGWRGAWRGLVPDSDVEAVAESLWSSALIGEGARMLLMHSRDELTHEPGWLSLAPSLYAEPPLGRAAAVSLDGMAREARAAMELLND